MDIYELIGSMTPYIKARDWDGLEAEFREKAFELVGGAITDFIAAVDLASYQNALQSALNEADKIARQQFAAAVYFEYDLDNGWSSAFYICPDYVPLNGVDNADDDWACDYSHDLNGPALPEFAALYKSTPGFSTTDADTGKTIYLIARTLAAFGCCSDSVEPTYALCFAFHDQDSIMRIKESTNR